MRVPEFGYLQNTLNIFLDKCRCLIYTHKHISVWKKFTPEKRESTVTSMDIEIEELFSAIVLAEFPEACLFGEECHTDITTLEAEMCFIIDPIDGTNEFVAGSPNYAISIAVLHKGIVEYGVLDFPAQKSRYWSAKRNGSSLNESIIHVSEEYDLEKLKIGVSPSQKKAPDFFIYEDRLKRAEMVPIGSLTSKVSQVACGGIDAAFFIDGTDHLYSLWDFAACKLILEEAGGLFTDLTGNEITNSPVTKKSGWLATNSKCHQLLLELIREASIEIDRKSFF